MLRTLATLTSLAAVACAAPSRRGDPMPAALLERAGRTSEPGSQRRRAPLEGIPRLRERWAAPPQGAGYGEAAIAAGAATQLATYDLALQTIQLPVLAMGLFGVLVARAPGAIADEVRARCEREVEAMGDASVRSIAGELTRRAGGARWTGAVVPTSRRRRLGVQVEVDADTVTVEIDPPPLALCCLEALELSIDGRPISGLPDVAVELAGSGVGPPGRGLLSGSAADLALRVHVRIPRPAAGELGPLRSLEGRLCQDTFSLSDAQLNLLRQLIETPVS